MSGDSIAASDVAHRAGEKLRALVRWWVGELLDCMPARWRRQLASLGRPPVLIVSERGACLADADGDHQPPLAIRPRRRPEGVVLRIAEEQAFHTLVTLPLAAERNLDQVVGFEFERLTPFQRSDVYYSARIVGRDGKSRRIEVALSVVGRAAVAEAVRTVHVAGFRAVAVELAGPHGATAVACEGLLDIEGRKFTLWRRRAVMAAGALVAALAVAAVTIPLVRSELELRSLRAHVDAAQQAAIESARLRTAIENEAKQSAILVERKRGTVPIVAVLEELTRLLPDDVWLTDLAIEGKEVHLSGFATSAATLIGILDHSRMFADAAYRSPVTEDAAMKREEFDIAAKIVGKAP